ncbi:MAG: hypothetical protein EBU21_14300, partial [Proteobacteria bacterium]|nr:hypothetical protein [Pseudomonadota bacterium]
MILGGYPLSSEFHHRHRRVDMVHWTGVSAVAGLEARVQRVGQGLVVIALSLMAMVAIGSTTAHAEN